MMARSNDTPSSGTHSECRVTGSSATPNVGASSVPTALDRDSTSTSAAPR